MLNSTKRKLGFGLLNLLFFGISIGAGVTLVRQSQEVRSRAQQEPGVYLIPDLTDISVGQRVAVVIEVDSVNAPIGYAYMKLAFNHNILTAVRIEPGPFFDDPQVNNLQYDNDTGDIVIDLVSISGDVLSSGKGDIAIIVFEAKAPGNGEIIAARSHISINNDAPSIVDGTFQTLITVTE